MLTGLYVLAEGVRPSFELNAFPLLFSRHSIEGTLIGGVDETKEILDFLRRAQLRFRYSHTSRKSRFGTSLVCRGRKYRTCRR